MAGSSNLKQFNPTKANQLNDTDYNNSSYRQNGAVAGVAPSEVHNKLFYQLSTFIAAFGAMMAAKGYTISDSVYADLITELDDVITTADMEAYAAKLAGDATVNFSVKDATTAHHAVALDQLTAALASVEFPVLLDTPIRLVNQGNLFAWTDVDCTAYVPAGAKQVYLGVQMWVVLLSSGVIWSGSNTLNIRQKGTNPAFMPTFGTYSVGYNIGIPAIDVASGTCFVGIDTNHKFQAQLTGAAITSANIWIDLLGYGY
jgi:hypothetical protein